MTTMTKKTLDKRITIRISEDRALALKERAAYYSAPIGDIIRTAIDIYLEEEADTDERT